MLAFSEKFLEKVKKKTSYKGVSEREISPGIT